MTSTLSRFIDVSATCLMRSGRLFESLPAGASIGIKVESKLGGDYDLSLAGSESFAHQFFVQYQKQLRLHVARERMLSEGLDAASAAFEVGYESASQFNREYSRFFGDPPMRDIRARRLAIAVTNRE